jgi:phosphoserine phosphatase
MNELCAWDLDGTVRPGSLTGDAVLHAGEAGFIDLDLFADPSNPSYAEVPYFISAITSRSRKDFKELIDKISDEAREKSYPFALERLNFQAEHAHPVIISHAPAFLVKAFARGLGNIRHARGSYLHTQEYIFSGRVVELHKLQAVKRYQRENRIKSLIFAAGDTHNDLPMLENAVNGLVVNPNQELEAIAKARNWEIVRS